MFDIRAGRRHARRSHRDGRGHCVGRSIRLAGHVAWPVHHRRGQCQGSPDRQHQHTELGWRQQLRPAPRRRPGLDLRPRRRHHRRSIDGRESRGGRRQHRGRRQRRQFHRGHRHRDHVGQVRDGRIHRCRRRLWSELQGGRYRQGRTAGLAEMRFGTIGDVALRAEHADQPGTAGAAETRIVVVGVVAAQAIEMDHRSHPLGTLGGCGDAPGASRAQPTTIRV